MPTFQYHADIFARYPNLAGGVILAEGVTNGPTPDALREAYMAEQRATLDRIGETPLSELGPLAAWRGAFRGFGVNPTKYRSAPEALLRRLTKKMYEIVDELFHYRAGMDPEAAPLLIAYENEEAEGIFR